MLTLLPCHNNSASVLVLDFQPVMSRPNQSSARGPHRRKPMTGMCPWIPIYSKHDAVLQQQHPPDAHNVAAILASPFNYQYDRPAGRGNPRFLRPRGRQYLGASCRAMASTNRLAKIISTPIQGFHPTSSVFCSSSHAKAPWHVTSRPFQTLPNAPLLLHAVPSYTSYPARHGETVGLDKPSIYVLGHHHPSSTRYYWTEERKK
ncbi:hypothetical protein JOL62DRAFT_308468 [Phyllosticta paracitricarpa]|uniref:Uncharacterized protein n=1 Tax=Phyllosticta paracitricarpa TaxID=2016321 RepID=A0ABR1NH27_9PEZI